MPDLRYYKNTDEDILVSEPQWKWLESIYEDTNDDVYIVVSGIQMITSNRMLKLEDWPKKEAARMLDMVSNYERPTVFVSGDVHHA